MLIKKDEAHHMYCPLKFSKHATKGSEQISPEWRCEGIGCMAWQTAVGSRWAGEHGFCGLAGKPADIGTEPRSIHDGPSRRRA